MLLHPASIRGQPSSIHTVELQYVGTGANWITQQSNAYYIIVNDYVYLRSSSSLTAEVSAWICYRLDLSKTVKLKSLQLQGPVGWAVGYTVWGRAEVHYGPIVEIKTSPSYSGPRSEEPPSEYVDTGSIPNSKAGTWSISESLSYDTLLTPGTYYVFKVSLLRVRGGDAQDFEAVSAIKLKDLRIIAVLEDLDSKISADVTPSSIYRGETQPPTISGTLIRVSDNQPLKHKTVKLYYRIP